MLARFRDDVAGPVTGNMRVHTVQIYSTCKVRILTFACNHFVRISTALTESSRISWVSVHRQVAALLLPAKQLKGPVSLQSGSSLRHAAFGGMLPSQQECRPAALLRRAAVVHRPQSLSTVTEFYLSTNS